MMTSRANRVGAHSETMIFTRATHKVSLQPISMICPKVAGRSLAEDVNLPARCCTLLSSAVKMAELEQQLELLWPHSRPPAWSHVDAGTVPQTARLRVSLVRRS